MTMENTSKTQAEKPEQPKTQRRPDEVGSLQVQTHLRIFDPKTKDTIVETRG